jgi:hypothetical protein
MTNFMVKWRSKLGFNFRSDQNDYMVDREDAYLSLFEFILNFHKITLFFINI